jgi:TolA-binding protein
MARSLDKLGRTDEARDTWKRILKLEPENETAKQELRELEEREG